MDSFFPILLAILIIGITFISAMKKGVISILSGGIAAFFSLIVLFGTFNFLPQLSEAIIGISLTWKLTLIASIIFAIPAYAISRLLAGWITKAFFDPDGWFNDYSDGFFGGIFSLFPSLVVVSFSFVCIRVTGTVHELNYIASLSQPGIENTSMEFPDWPIFTHWRDTLEKAPMLSSAFDLVEPFSRRQNRNLAALAIMKRSEHLNSFLKLQPGAGPLINLPEVVALDEDKTISKALDQHRQFDLVLASAMQKTADGYVVKSDLKDLKIRKLAEAIIKSLPKPDQSE